MSRARDLSPLGTLSRGGYLYECVFYGSSDAQGTKSNYKLDTEDTISESPAQTRRTPQTMGVSEFRSLRIWSHHLFKQRWIQASSDGEVEYLTPTLS